MIESIALLASIALLGAGAKTTPPSAPSGGIRKAITGTVVITPTHGPGPGPKRAWFYANHQIVGVIDAASKGIEPIEIDLVPGDYTIESLVEIEGEGSETFPFLLESENVTIKAGKSVKVRLEMTVTLNFGHAVSTIEGAGLDLTVLDGIERDVAAAGKRFDADPAVIALREVAEAFTHSPPMTTVVYVGMPKEAGGPREFDAAQIRILASWVHRTHWAWWPPIAASEEAKMPADVRSAYERYSIDVEKHIANSIRPLSGIADKLSQAKK